MVGSSAIAASVTVAPASAVRIENVAQPRTSWPELDIHPERDPLPLLEERSVVDVVITACRIETAYQGRRFVELRCEVLEGGERKLMKTPDGELGPVVLPWYLPLPKAKKDGRLSIPTASKFWRAWTMANGGRKPGRRDRMPLRTFENRMLRVTVRTVKTTSSGAKLPVHLWHSIVDDVAP